MEMAAHSERHVPTVEWTNYTNHWYFSVHARQDLLAHLENYWKGAGWKCGPLPGSRGIWLGFAQNHRIHYAVILAGQFLDRGFEPAAEVEGGDLAAAIDLSTLVEKAVLKAEEAWQSGQGGYANLFFLPKAMPPEPGRPLPSAGLAMLKLGHNGVITDFDAPQDLQQSVEQSLPWMRQEVLGELKVYHLALPHKFLLALVSTLQGLGYQLVAPRELAVLADEGLTAALARGIASASQVAFLPAFKPLAPPDVRTEKTGAVMLELGSNGAVKTFKAAESLRSPMQQILPWMAPEILQRLQDLPELDSARLTGGAVRTMLSLGYELVAPRKLPEQIDTASQDDSLLVFLPSAQLTAEQKCLTDIQSRAGKCCPPGCVTLRVNQSGMLTFFEAPAILKDILEEAFPWVRADSLHELQGVCAEFSPRVREVIVAALTGLGYKQIMHTVNDMESTYRFFRPEESAMRAEEMLALRAELEATVRAQGAEVETLRAHFAEAMEVCMQQRAGLEALEEARAQEHQALRAELVEARRERDAALAELRERQGAQLEALEELQGQVSVLACGQQREEESLASSKGKSQGRKEQETPQGQHWPTVEVYDKDKGTPGAAKHIRIECPGLADADITFRDNGNGVTVFIKGKTHLKDYVKDFRFDNGTLLDDLRWEMRQDETSYDDGILTIVLRRTPAKDSTLEKAPPSRGLFRILKLCDAPKGLPACAGDKEMYYDDPSVVDIGSPPSEAMPACGTLPSPSALYADMPACSTSGRSVRKPCGPASVCGSVAASVWTERSVVSAPPCVESPCCFLTDTKFYTTKWEEVAAGSLKAGTKLLGEDEREVTVLSAKTQPNSARDLVALKIEGFTQLLIVTADHRLVEVLSAGRFAGHTVFTKARDFVSNRCQFLYNGKDSEGKNKKLVVVGAALKTEVCRVVEVKFEDDAVALTWVLPRKNHPHSRDGVLSLRDKAIPMLGEEFKRWEIFCDAVVQGTFLNFPRNLSRHPCAGLGTEELTPPRRRIRSEGELPVLDTTWSRGNSRCTICNDEESLRRGDGKRKRCEPCIAHQQYLWDLQGPTPELAEACGEGGNCKQCHGSHLEWLQSLLGKGAESKGADGQQQQQQQQQQQEPSTAETLAEGRRRKAKRGARQGRKCQGTCWKQINIGTPCGKCL